MKRNHNLEEVLKSTKRQRDNGAKVFSNDTKEVK